MKKSNCITYFAVLFKFDNKKDLKLLKEKGKCQPEDIGIFNQDDVCKYIKNTFGVTPKWNKHHFMIGYNEKEKIELNESIRDTIKDLIGKEKRIKEMCKKYGAFTSLIVRLKITKKTKEQNQTLKINNDIIDFLYKSNTTMDLDY